MRWIKDTSLSDTLEAIKVMPKYDTSDISKTRRITETYSYQTPIVEVIKQPTTITIVPTRTVNNHSCTCVDLIYNLAGIAKENINVSFASSNKRQIIVSCLKPTIMKDGTEVKFADFYIDFMKGEFLNFVLDTPRGHVIFENGMLKIPLRRELELPKAPSLEIVIK